MGRSLEIREKRATVIQNARLIVDAAESDKRDLTEEELEQFNAMMGEAEALESEAATAEAAEEVEEAERSLKQSKRRTSPKGPTIITRQDTHRDAFRAWATYGAPFVPGADRLMRAAQLAGLNPANRRLSLRAQSLTDSAGGYTVAPAFFDKLTEALKAFGAMLNVADVIPRDTGATLPFPTADDTGNVGEIITENSEVNDQDITFSEVEIATFLYSSKNINVSYQLLQDSAIDLEAYLGKALGERIGRILNQHLTTGAGTTLPYGVVTGAQSGVVHSPATGAISYDDLVDLQGSVDDAYQDNSQWMMSRTTFNYIRKLVDDSGRPLVWSSNDRLENDGATPIILGKPVTINRDIADVASSAKCVLYGDFNYYKVLQVQDVEVLRLDELRARFHQVAFLAFARFGGRLVNAGGSNAPIKYLQA